MNINPLYGVIHDRESKALPAQLLRNSASILFVGNHCNFSHSLMSVTDRELGDLTLATALSLHELRDIIESAPGQPALIVLDEPTMRNLGPDDRAYLIGLSDIALAIAFTSSGYGTACYHDAQLRQRGASIFPLDMRLDVWLSVIRMVAHGGNYIAPEIIAPPAAPATEPLDEIGLTQRQHDVMRLVADGRSNKQIAAELDLSIHTVKLHLRNANLRLGAHNRTEAAMRYRAPQA